MLGTEGAFLPGQESQLAGSTSADAGLRPTGETDTQVIRPGYRLVEGDADFTLSSPPAALASPAIIPGYELLGELGRGGMGVVYKARQTSLQRVVALKMMLAGEFAHPEVIARFHSEARAVARLQHPNIVQIFESGTHEQQPYFSMEYVDGCTLSRWMADGPQSPRAVAAMVETLARAMHYAHENGIIHRDLKPANVLLTRGGQPKISDFGLAKFLNDTSAGLTLTGSTMGTPEYMAPEQIAGDGVGPAADVYTLGVMLYEMLTSRCPFAGETKWLTLEMVRAGEPIAPTRLRPLTPRDLETICLKCLRKEPHQRYGSAEALADDLRRFLNAEPIQARQASELERAWRWCRRRPLVSGLLTALITVTCTGFYGVTWSYLQADAARRDEQVKRQEADAAQRLAVEQRERAETNLYYSRIALAARFLEGNDLAAAKRLLGECLPETRGTDQRDWEWHYLDRLCRQERLTLEGHTGHVFHVAFSPKGDLLASAGGGNAYYENPGQKVEPGEVILWNATTGAPLRTLHGQQHLITHLAFSPDGGRLASASHDHTFKIWDVATGKALVTGTGHRAAVLRVVYSPSGKYLITVAADKQVKLWDAASGKELRTFAGEDAAFSPDEEQVALADGKEGRTILWDLAQSREAFTLPSAASVLAYSPTAKLLATGQPLVQLWDLTTRRPIPVAADQPADRLAFSPDGKLLACVVGECVFIQETATGRMRQHLVGHNGKVTSAAFSPDSRLFATGGADQTVRVWDLQTGKDKLIFRGHSQSANSVAFHPQGGLLASAAVDGTIRLWDLTHDPRGLKIAIYPFRGEHLKSFALDVDADRLYTVLNKNLQTWDAATGKLLGTRELDIIDKFACPRHDVAFTADARLLAAPSHQDPSLVKLWQTATGAEIASFPGHDHPVRCVALSGDGKFLALAERLTLGDRTTSDVILWDVDAHQELWRRTGIPQRIGALAFRADGRKLASGGCDDSIVRVWDAVTGIEQWSLPGCEAALSLAFRGDGQRLAAADFAAEKIYVWDLTTGQAKLTIPGPYALTSVTFSPNGRRLAATGYLGDVRFWDAATGQESFTLPGFAPARQGDYAFTGRVLFSADGRRIVSNNWDGTVNVWEAEKKVRDDVEK